MKNIRIIFLPLFSVPVKEKNLKKLLFFLMGKYSGFLFKFYTGI